MRLTRCGFQKSIPGEQFAFVAQNNLFPPGNRPAPELVSVGKGIYKYKVAFAQASPGMYICADSAGKLKTENVKSDTTL